MAAYGASTARLQAALQTEAADQPPPPKKHGGPWYAPSQDLKVKAKEAQPPQQEPGEQQHVGPWLAPNQAHKLNASAAKRAASTEDAAAHDADVAEGDSSRRRAVVSLLQPTGDPAGVCHAWCEKIHVKFKKVDCAFLHPSHPLAPPMHPPPL